MKKFMKFIGLAICVAVVGFIIGELIYSSVANITILDALKNTFGM